MNPRFDRTLRVGFTQGQQAALCLLEDLFQEVVGVGLVSGNPGSFGKIKVVPLHRTRIAAAARGQEKLDWLTLFGDQPVQLEAIN